MTLAPSSRLGSYEILERLGKGGMGEVYRARDTRLGRSVAIKVLPPDLAADQQRLNRFEQEARAASALNHPNIVVIYEIGQVDSGPYIAMEIVEGKTLREILASGPLSTKKILRYAVQLANGLARAHAAGIVHRDLKPENLMVGPDGLLKILDFGLAKLINGETPADFNMQATATARTEAGMIVGTVGYMSPEQASGRTADFRSDHFAFGAILYEMTTSIRAFQRDTAVETLSAIIRDEPDPIAAFKPNVPAPLRWTIDRCLSKHSEERYACTDDLARELQDIENRQSELYGSEQSASEPSRSARWRRFMSVGLGIVALIIGSGLVAKYSQKSSALPPEFHQITFRRGAMSRARFAPDGETIVYAAAWDGKPLELYTARLGSAESRSLGLVNADIFSISPSGEMAVAIGCTLNWGECHDATLARMALAGGAPREVLEHVDSAEWSPSGKELAVIHIADGRYRLEYPIGKILYESPGWITHARLSPKGDVVAFLEHPVLSEITGSVELVDLNGKKRTLSRDWKGLFGLAWSPKGDEIWFTGSATGQGVGQAVYAVDLAGRQRVVYRSPQDVKIFDVSRDQRRVLISRIDPRGFVVGMTPGSSKDRNLSWFDYSTAADLSQDGKTLLFYEWGEGSRGVPTAYIRKTDGSDPIRLGDGRPLALSSDGKWTVALQQGPPQQLILLATGAGEQKQLPRGAIEEYYSATWFPDGERILFAGKEAGHQPRSYVQDLAGGLPQAVTAEATMATLLSPDGKLVATLNIGGYSLCTIESRDCNPIPGVLDEDTLLQWSADGRFLYVRGSGDLLLRIYRVNLSNGQRELWKDVTPPDPVGLIGIALDPGQVRITPDGKFYVYTYWSALSDLFVAEGLK